jgi:hypothetical protein
MAFDRSNLARMGGANTGAGSLWMYRSTDAYATIVATDYFLEAITEIKLNDYVLVVSATGGTPVATASYMKTNSGTSNKLATGLTVTA